MFKVLCIKDTPDIGYSRGGKINPIPPENRCYCGEQYTVAEIVKGYQGELKYKLSERPSNYRYRKVYFSPLSEIDETEMERNYKTEKPCLA